MLVPRIPIAPGCLNGIALRFMRLLIKRFFSVEPSVEIQNILRIQELVLYELCDVVERVVLVGVREVYVAVAVGRTVDLVFDCQPNYCQSDSGSPPHRCQRCIADSVDTSAHRGLWVGGDARAP